jgi:hypothetical protein
MRPGRLIALTVFVAAVAAFVWFFERKQPTTDERRERADRLFAGFEQDRARRVVVTNKHGRFELVKEKDSWRLVAPLADDANPGAVSSLLSTVAALKADRTLEAKDLKLADYGLAPAALEVTVEGEAGRLADLKVGGELPLGNLRAALTTGEKVFLVNTWIASDLERDLGGWRSTDLVQVMSADVASLTIAAGTERIALAHAEGAWTLTEPVADLAERDRAEGLIGDLNGAQIKEHVDEPGDLAALGLAAPRLLLTVVRKDAAPVQLAFGDEREKDGRQVACRRGERVLWVDANAVTRASAALADWRARALTSFDTWSVSGLEVEAGAAKVALERAEGVWKVGSTEVDSDAVSRRLRAFADLQALAFDRPKPAGTPLGKVVVRLEAGAPVEATFYPGGAPGEALAVVSGRAGALPVDAARVGEVLADPAALAAPKPTPVPPATPATTPTKAP